MERRGWGLLFGLAFVSVALFAAYSGVLSVLLPQQVATIAPQDKVASLAVITSISFAVTALAQPLFGALSDRTRSRWGRRIPWMIAGAIAGGAAIGAMEGAQSVALLAVLWAAAQFALNATDIASSVYLVDAFPSERRGRVAGVLGLSAVIGGAAGAVVAGMFITSLAEGYVLLAATVVIAVAIFAALFREKPILEEKPRDRFRLGAFLMGFWIDPRHHPDFSWVLVWRIVFSVAYGSVHGYLFYILTDFIGASEAAAPGLVAQITVVGGAGVAIAVIGGGWLSDMIGRRKPFLVVASAVVVIAEIVLLFAPSIPGIFGLAGALGFGLGLAIACGTALASDVLPDPVASAARGLGIVNLGTNLGQAGAPLVAAVAISNLGGYPALFIASAALMGVAGSVVFAIRGAR